MSVDDATVLRVAKLARIAVTDDDAALLTNELNNILAWIEQLDEVDVDGGEPMTSVSPMRLKRRADIVTDGGDPAIALTAAPDAREGFFVVPKIVE